MRSGAVAVATESLLRRFAEPTSEGIPLALLALLALLVLLAAIAASVTVVVAAS
jgi:hypothetical protein